MMAAKPHPVGLTTALDVIGGKWKVPILCELRFASRRFGELRRLLPGVSEKVLVQQLREMEADAVVDRRVYDEVPPKVTYSLTHYGISLHEALAPLGEWGANHLWRAKSQIREPELAIGVAGATHQRIFSIGIAVLVGAFLGLDTPVN